MNSITNKPLLILSAPVATRSGYGDHSRDLFHAINAMDKYNIKVLSQRWGECPINALSANNVDDKKIIDCLIHPNDIKQKPDVWIQVTVPNEYQAVGKYNIGITAGIESTQAPVEWIDGCNKMDLIITTSEHSKNVLVQTKYEERNNQGQLVKFHELFKKIEVVFEGYDKIYHPKQLLEENSVKEIDNTLNSIPEDFNYLFVGHWLKGDVGHDRKDVYMLIKTFLTTFKNKKKMPGLILKTSGAGFSVMDREQMISKIEHIKKHMDGDLPNVYLIHGDLSKEEMAKLYKHPKIKVHVSFTKGEGFGRPLLEASLSGKPVVASNWSGHVDFLDDKNAVMLEGSLGNIHSSSADKFLLAQANWFNVNYSKAAQKLLHIYEHYDSYIPRSKKLSEINAEKFSHEKMAERLKQVFDDNVKITEEVKLNLPKLKKVGTSEPPKITLPKLKKV